MKVDVILGLQHGDEGKGKVCHSLLSDSSYTHVLRFNGGGNAGHTIFHNGKKFITHLIPAGVFYGKKSIIGSGCVVNVSKFFEELNYLKANGIETEGLVFIAENAHIVTGAHVNEDSLYETIGTTKTGNGPAYRDKYARVGVRVSDIPELKPYLINLFDEFYGVDSSSYEILAEGAQAFALDIDWGDYPYVTSSHCGIGSVLLNGISHRDIRDVYGVIKAYDTYVGAKKFQPPDEIFEKIQSAGQEFGATTGRKRQVNWLNWDIVLQAIQMNGVNHLFVNKVDILQEVSEYKIRVDNHLFSYNTVDDFCGDIKDWCDELGVECKFSFSPHKI